MVLDDLETVSLTRTDHRVDIAIARPDQRNALTLQAVEELTAAFEHAQTLEDARAITLTGEGSVFCAGMDLEMMSGTANEDEAGAVEEVSTLFGTIEHCDLPVVAGIKGAAVAGGFELTLPADLRIIGESATYGVPEVKFGLFPAGGTITRLPRIVGLSNAKEIALLGNYVDPERAREMGLVMEVTADGQVDTRTREVADELASRAPLGVQGALEAFDGIFDLSIPESLERERALCQDLFGTADVEEGMAARQEGREPAFEGR